MNEIQRQKHIAQSLNWKRRNPEKVKLQSKRYYQKNKSKILARQQLRRQNGCNLKRYGIDIEEYENILKKQNNVCAICKNKELATLNGKVKKLSVDHCHNTNNVRGLLCDRCNRGLGYFRDRVDYLTNAITYLQKNEK